MGVNRTICQPFEADGNNVMGIDGEGNCVYWIDEGSKKYELLNDGTCADKSSSTRNTYSTLADCTNKSQSVSWGCVEHRVEAGYVGYCAISEDGDAQFASLADCEQQCNARRTPTTTGG